jgi:lysophospholipase L1-like esterase
VKVNKTFIVFASVIIIQLVVIAFIGANIIKKRNNVLGKSITVLDKDTVRIGLSDRYKHYYEPVPGVYETVLPWSDESTGALSTATYLINADTLNDTQDYPFEKKSDSFRIVAIGDSFTFGQYVATDKNWPSLLEDKLNKRLLCSHINNYEVLNLGVYGYDTAYEVERYRLRGRKYNPDIIIWLVTDTNRITEKYWGIFEKYKLSVDALSSWEKARDIVIKEMGYDKVLAYQIDKFNELSDKYFPKRPILIISNNDEVSKIGKNFLFEDTNIFEGSKENFLPDGHFNEKGHEIFAEEVVEALNNKQLLPCRY